jgi:SAM-dependent methyltransferase
MTQPLTDTPSRVIWDALYAEGNYAPIAPYTDIIAFLARAFAREGHGRKVLEIGCGTAQNLLFAAWSMGFEVYGVDYSEAAIAQARAQFQAKGLSYGALDVADAAHLSYLDASFDAVVERAVLQQNRYETARAMLAEMRRVLKPGGVLCCSLAAEGHFLFGQGEHLGGGDFFNGEHDGSRHFFARRDILDLFAGLEITRWMLHSRQDVPGNRMVEQYHVVEARKLR